MNIKQRDRDSEVTILGSGFSKALVSEMPLTNQLTEAIKDRIKSEEDVIKALWTKHVENNNVGNVNDEEGNFEEILSYLDDSFPCKDHLQKLEHRILYHAITTLIIQHLAEIKIDYKTLFSDKPWLKDFIKYIRDRKVSIITFNYDTIFEGLLINSDSNGNGKMLCETGNVEGYYSKVNYFKDTYFIASNSILLAIPHRFYFKTGSGGSSFREGADTLQAGLGNNPKLLKLHGSLNWLYSEYNKSVICDDLEFFDNSCVYVEEIKKTFIEYQQELQKSFPRFLDEIRERYKPLIIPPIQNKTPEYINNNIIKEQWIEAGKILSKAKKINIIGYSLPDTDLATMLMLKTSINNKDCEVFVCYEEKNDEKSQKLKDSYRNALGSATLRFCSTGFSENWINTNQ